MLQRRPDPEPTARTWKILAVLAVFVLCGVIRYRHAQGDDLASSYIGCRLVAAHGADHLYSYDPADFAAVGPDEPVNAWQEAADAGNFEGYLHPYVQTPLWAYALQPLCTRTQFPAFEAVFLVLSMLSFAAFLWLSVRFWAPACHSPVAYGLLAAGLWISEPFRYAMMLVQTHILLMLLTVLAFVMAERRRPGLAGFLLALAAAVKITPAILVLYWLLTRRYKAAMSAIAWSVALAALTLVAVGRTVMTAYLADLHRISGILLLSQNNQSFVAWAMAYAYPSSEVSAFHMLPLPTAMRLGSAALMVAVTAVGGWFDRRAEDSRRGSHLGAAMGLVAATVFAPIAWTHYSFILLVPVLVLLQANRKLRSTMLYAITAVIVALNLRPFASDVEAMRVGALAVVRGQFFAAVLCLLALSVVAWSEQARTEAGADMQDMRREDSSQAAA